MKKIALTACIIFAVLTFIGIGYALWKGKNAGYAVIPMAIFVICLAFYRSKDKKTGYARRALCLFFVSNFQPSFGKKLRTGRRGYNAPTKSTEPNSATEPCRTLLTIPAAAPNPSPRQTAS